MVNPREIRLPAVAPPVEKVVWRELFKYPRSIAAGCLAGLSGTGITGFLLWQVTLFVMVLHVTPAQASGLVIWLSLGQIAIFQMAEVAVPWQMFKEILMLIARLRAPPAPT
jgi:hypothetical protein